MRQSFHADESQQSLAIDPGHEEHTNSTHIIVQVFSQHISFQLQHNGITSEQFTSPRYTTLRWTPHIQRQWAIAMLPD